MPPETRVLVAPLAGVGRDFPLSIEKLCPVLAFYVVKDWHEGCERVLQLLRYGGTGHTMAIHSKDDAVIREFALKKPVFRIVANTQSSMGATGYTTGLAPSMSLGLRRLRRQHHVRQHHAAAPHQREAAGLRAAARGPGRRAARPRDLPAQVAAFVGERLGGRGPAPAAAARAARAARPPRGPRRRPSTSCPRTTSGAPSARAGRSRSRPGAIVTPSARDLADGKNVLDPRPGRSPSPGLPESTSAAHRATVPTRSRRLLGSARRSCAGSEAGAGCEQRADGRSFVVPGRRSPPAAPTAARPPRKAPAGPPHRRRPAPPRLIASADAHLARGHRREPARATSNAPARSSTAPSTST